ncbi:MAG: indole-3-glycerol phosphate synthase [Patiriisocius sp.]|jgi:indole-3-glycerol phosphate synthase
MKNILEEIKEHKRIEVQEKKELYPIKLLESSQYFKSPCLSLNDYILRDDMSGVIAEFKRRSPSKGDINVYGDVEKVTIGYMQAGASALSILTDEKFFGGKSSDLTVARNYNYCPILRKDFIVDEYQIIESRSIGADAILLIAECLSKAEIQQFTTLAKNLGMEVLCELHNEDQLVKLNDDIDLIGVNNRDLKVFKTSIQNSIRIKESLPTNKTLISESGINSLEDIALLKSAGFHGFLIGELFMKEEHPELAARNFISSIV